ncbi:MAG TPA: adenylate/guanylate cyclase domain-containing protein [Ktedonosporobacter sp.]|nr:adenylate/guanylate cyclase domain-containing protein [Ktedonosporobacter sp.]
MPEERKLVTVLFADVTESTALGDTLDPEDVRALMSRYYTHARQVVTEHGGTLEKFIGDAVMAVFGLPQAHGDDAERALAAALALHEAVANDKLLGPSFQLRIGANTGEVIATSAASDHSDFLVTGDAVNMAARLQQCAAPGETLVGERTMNAARLAFIFKPARVVEVKGKRQPLQVFPLKCQRNMRQVTRPPLVGRRQDLLQLELLQARVLEEQRPQMVSIVAPAGTGKSRLFEEFLGHLNPDDGFQVATVRCLPYGQALTYWPLRGLLTALLGAEITRVRVIEIFRQGGYTPEAAVRQADFVLTGLGMHKEGNTARECIFGAWRLLIEIMAQTPRVIVFEDLHWASDNLLDLVEFITNLHIQAPILFIALSRPELLDRRPNWGGGRQNFTSLALQPLTTRQTRDLIRQLMKDAPEATREQIAERSGGNPFFALELIRGLSEQKLTGNTVTLPDTVHAAVLSRLDQLSPQERVIIQVASVASRSIRPAMLQAVLEEYSLQEIEDALDSLVARDFIVPAEAGTGTFTFRHILISNIAYGTLARSVRIRLHGKIAMWLEEVAAERIDEYVELIAYHYHEAIRLAQQSAVPSTLPIEPERAVRYLKRAGEMAGHMGAFEAARAHVQNAIEIAPETEHVALYELLGDSLTWTTFSIEAYQKALEHWRNSTAADPLVGARLRRKLLICYTRGHIGCLLPLEVSGLRAEAEALVKAAGDEEEHWRLRVADTFIFWHAHHEPGIPEGTAEDIRRIGLEAAAYFKQKENWPAYSEALDAYAALSMEIGAFQDALEALQQRLAAPNLPAIERGDALQMTTKVYLRAGDFHNCIATIKEALASIRSGQPLTHLGTGVSHAVQAAFISGRWSEVSALTPILDEMWKQVQYDPSSFFIVADGYFAVLQMALAREDTPTVDATTSILKRIYADETDPYRLLLDAIVADCPQKLTDTLIKDEVDARHAAFQALFLYNERGVVIPETFIAQILDDYTQRDIVALLCEIARALAAGDNNRLAHAIDQAEAHHLIVHAARMRIVLAQRTRDLTHLDNAQSVLEQLGDQQGLCKLEEVKLAMV